VTEHAARVRWPFALACTPRSRAPSRRPGPEPRGPDHARDHLRHRRWRAARRRPAAVCALAPQRAGGSKMAARAPPGAPPPASRSGRRSAGWCSGAPAGDARPVAAGAPSRSTTSSSAPKGARTSISTASWRSVAPATPRPMPPTGGEPAHHHPARRRALHRRGHPSG
jgi:hypothetical protein